MICKSINLINTSWKKCTMAIQAIVFDANNVCYRISQLTQLTSPERFDQMKYVEQQEESLQQIVSIPREESQTQIVSGIYYHNALLQNLSEQDTCFDSKDLIDLERNAVDLYDPTGSVIAKGKCLSAASVRCQQCFQQNLQHQMGAAKSIQSGPL